LSFGISTSFDLMAGENKTVDPALSEFYEAMDAESENEDAKDRPWRPSHVVFEKSTIKQEQIDAMRGRYFRDISIMRDGGE
jgi:hypothetical protein